MNYENLLKVKENADEEETRMNFLNLIQGAAGKVKGVATLLSGLTKTQAIIAGVATVTAVGGVGTGGYFLYDHFHQPEPIVADVVRSCGSRRSCHGRDRGGRTGNRYIGRKFY